MTLKRHLISGAIAAAAALTIGVAPAAANARYPYTLIEPGTFGGPGSFLDEPGVSITSNGTVLGTADTTTPDPDLSPSGFHRWARPACVRVTRPPGRSRCTGSSGR